MNSLPAPIAQPASRCREIENDLHKNLIELKELARGGIPGAADVLCQFRCGQWIEYNHMVWEAAQKGEKLGGKFSPEEEILNAAITATQRLLWLGENKPDSLRPYLARCEVVPVLIGVSDVEKRFRAVWKKLDGGASLPFKNSAKTKSDVFHNVATNAIRYLTGPCDSFIQFYFYKRIRGLSKMARPESDHAIDEYRSKKLGRFTRGSWPGWKPIFADYITLRFDLPWERWKRLPESKRTNVMIALYFGCFDEWFTCHVKRMRLTESKRNARRKEFEDLKSVKESLDLPRLEDRTDDEAIRSVVERSRARNTKFTDIREAILRRCQRLAPRE